VQVPSLSSTQDTTIYMYFGNTGATDQSSPTAPWDSNFKSVYHLPNGGSLSVTDSIGNNNGANNGAGATSGQIDGAASFNGTSQYISAGVTNFNTGTNPRTIEGWVKETSAPGVSVPFVYGQCGVGNDTKAFGVYIDASKDLHFWGCGTGDFDATTTVSTN